MTSSEEIWRDFHPDRNRVRVTDENKARVYFAQLRRALEALQGAIEQGTSITNAERQATDRFVRRLRTTCDALALKYFYANSGSPLKIDASDSGFFHFSALLEARADLERKKSRLAELPAPGVLKQRMLRQIVDYGLHPRELQESMLERVYLEALEEDRIFRTFLPGELIRVGNGGEDQSYFWSFAIFDRTLNRPFVYLIYFRWSGRKALAVDSEEFGRIRSVAEQTAGGRINLLGFSNRWDQQLPLVHPRIVKRLLLGPFSSPHFTEAADDEDPLAELMTRLQDRLPWALRFETETLISERQTRVGEGWFSKGQLRQVFWIPKQIDLTARGVSQIERFVFLPQWLAQHLGSAGMLADHRHVGVDDDGSLHGLD